MYHFEVQREENGKGVPVPATMSLCLRKQILLDESLKIGFLTTFTILKLHIYDVDGLM